MQEIKVRSFSLKKIPFKLIIIYAVLLFFVLLINYPFIWMVATSLKSRTEVFTIPSRLFPAVPIWSNYAHAWALAPWAKYFFNTIIAAVVPTVGQMFFGALAAYAFTRNFRGSKIIFTFFLGTMMIPMQATLVPNYVILRNLSWINTYQGLTIPFITSAFSIFLLRQYFLTIPKDYEDAAVIDGSGPFYYLFRILVPLSKSALITVALFAFMDRWNDYIWPLIMTTKDTMRTVQVGMAVFQSESGTEWTYLMAASTFVSLPGIILFLIVQRRFIDGVMMSGVKG
ncbi:carbohydrate ABC transporter permease [Breznakiella homolactica]|uniref:Carbohydrate ABC transporter permease n=1 Tax=Breznakiella homolactica TaxID=2798577 RepID=A0A7T8B9S4_9SPIR|nr:carbohydrate ABC transporter permease [Breznakiella homolactica]QQO09904.1 carbohydrate ABC transporter permease [Breznakiella homolactica]